MAPGKSLDVSNRSWNSVMEFAWLMGLDRDVIPVLGHVLPLETVGGTEVEAGVAARAVVGVDLGHEIVLVALVFDPVHGLDHLERVAVRDGDADLAAGAARRLHPRYG